MTDTFWDGLSQKYAAKPIDDPDAYEAKLKSVEGYLTKDDHVLEVGCGTGTTALRLAPSVAQYTGCDISKGMIDIATSKLDEAAPDNVRFVQASADEILEGGPYDAILTFSLLHLVRDLPNTLKQLHAQLKTDGLFISKTVCLKHCNPLMRLAVKGLTLVGIAPYVLPLNEDDLIRHITEAGFEIEHVGYFDKHKRNFYVVSKKRDNG